MLLVVFHRHKTVGWAPPTGDAKTEMVGNARPTTAEA